MKVQIDSIKVFGAHDALPVPASLAVMNVSLDGEIVIRRCLLIDDELGRRVIPPQGRRAGDCPVMWDRTSSLAQRIDKAGLAAFGAMTAGR
jgi:hypothetical protein